MSANSKIEWTDASWNPLRGLNRRTGKIGWWCSHASPGCVNCYAEAFNERLGCQVAYKAQSKDDVEVFVDEGQDIIRVTRGARTTWLTDHCTTLGRPNALTQPTHWKKARVIFVCSMTDLFGEFVPDWMIDKVMVEIANNPRHTFIVVTKRSARMREYFAQLPMRVSDWDCHAGLDFAQFPLPNLWLMVSAEDQRRWNERVADLIATPAIVRGVSVEPQIEGIAAGVAEMKQLQWIIQGGESGKGARPFNIGWANAMRMACATSGVPYFLKQLGASPLINNGTPAKLKHPKGGDMDEWPEGLRVRERPPTAMERMTDA